MRLATCKASSQHTQHQSAAVLIHSSSAWHGWNSGTPLRPAPQVSGKVATCLVTGNLEPCLIGWAKMEALGIAHLFSQPAFGGFGSDFCSGNTEEMWHDRAELVRVAAERCSKQFPGACCHALHDAGGSRG